jgi:fructose-1,6-bisphosphatase-3
MSAADSPTIDATTLVYLKSLSHRYPTIRAALGEIAQLNSILTLPKGTIHIVSDVHGEFKKLKHIINNASGSLRPLVEKIFGSELSEGERLQLLNLIYYPRETFAHVKKALASEAEQHAFVRRTLTLQFRILRELARRYSVKKVEKLLPEEYRVLFRELLFNPLLQRSDAFIESLLAPFLKQGEDLELLRASAHLIRNLSISELIVAGDLGDRGPRIDKVLSHLMVQPNVAITWGNHDASWMGACLGQEALIATVLRVSLRYRRLSQLEEGYGITIAPLEKLARTVYGEDPAERFACKGEGLRDPLLMARMQKAIAILQFKLEGQLARRHPEWHMEHRGLLDCIDYQAGTIRIGDKTQPLLDRSLPTIDPADPFKLSPEEEACMSRLKQSFLHSPVLWEQMRFVEQRGAMWLVRDDTLIFHGCVPVDAEGNFLAMPVDGEELRGRALFDKLNQVVHRAFYRHAPADLDLLWYLWAGPLSPLFGKDRMATFETYFIADKETHKETKNPYFSLIHTKEFCARLFAEFGVDAQRGLIVNGHVPVKLEKGENPVKKSGQAVTIDGAFSEAYGDKGYTLVLQAAGIELAQHHHFESMEEAVTHGADIIPKIESIRSYSEPRRVADTETGAAIRREIQVLELLIAAYRANILSESRH